MYSTLSKSVGLFRRLKHYVPRGIMKTPYYYLIQSYTIYGIESLHGETQSATCGLHVLQKRKKNILRPCLTLTSLLGSMRPTGFGARMKENLAYGIDRNFKDSIDFLHFLHETFQ